MEKSNKSPSVVSSKKMDQSLEKYEKQNNRIILTKQDYYLGGSTFIFVGIVQLFVWNMCLNTLNSISTTIYKQGTIFDYLIGIYQIMNVITQLTLMYFGGARPFWFIGSASLLGFLVIIFALIVHLASQTVGPILLYLIMIPTGLCVGMTLGCGFTLSTIMPRQFCAHVGFGQGVAGLASFLLWILVSEGCFTVSDPDQLRRAIWVMYVVAAGISWICVVLFIITLRKPWAKHSLDIILHHQDDNNQDNNSTTDDDVTLISQDVKHVEVVDVVVVNKETFLNSQKGGGEQLTTKEGGQDDLDHAVVSPTITTATDSNWSPTSIDDHLDSMNTSDLQEISLAVPDNIKRVSPYLEKECTFIEKHPQVLLEEHGWTMILFKKSWIQLFNIGFTLFITLQMFPLIGPLCWNTIQQNSSIDVIMGMFQFGDFIGRYIPLIGKWPVVGRIAMIPNDHLIYYVIGRLGFIILFMLSFKLDYTPVINDLWYQIIIMLVFSITNGWFAMLAFVYAPAKVKNPKDKGKVALMGSVLLITGIVVGVWTARLYKL